MSYWDSLELLYVKNKRCQPSGDISKSTEAVEISYGSSDSHSSTVIERKITVTPKPRDEYELIREYSPKNSLIRKVRISKRKNAEIFYEEFRQRAAEVSKMKGEECPYVPLNMYSPTYTSLNRNQFRYYLWWRENLKEGRALRTDSGYILLLAEEIINLGKDMDVSLGQQLLIRLWLEYKDKVSGMPFRLIDWICDYGLVHGLPSPDLSLLVKSAVSLKEYFIHINILSGDEMAESLISYCSSYDYKKSKFATEENLPIYDKYVRGALNVALKHYSTEGKIFDKLDYPESRIERDSYVGVLCSTHEKYRISAEYCSFSTSSELRFLVGDVIKYAENRIRGYFGIKSRLSVYLIERSLKIELDTYFDRALPEKARAVHKPEEKQPYDILYDLPQKELSISEAKRIENDSWKTTEELVEAFEEENISKEVELQPVEKEIVVASLNCDEPSESGDLLLSLGKLCDFVFAVRDKDTALMKKHAATLGKMPDALVDAVNEIAVETYGDILIDGSDGEFYIIDDYLSYIE